MSHEPSGRLDEVQPWEAAAERYARWHGGDRRARAAAEAVAGLLTDLPGTLVLDLAVGPGSLARHLPAG